MFAVVCVFVSCVSDRQTASGGGPRLVWQLRDLLKHTRHPGHLQVQSSLSLSAVRFCFAFQSRSFLFRFVSRQLFPLCFSRSIVQSIKCIFFHQFFLHCFCIAFT